MNIFFSFSTFLFCLLSTVLLNAQCKCQAYEEIQQQFKRHLRQKHLDSASILHTTVQANASYPCQIKALYMSGSIHYQQGDYERAKNFYHQEAALLAQYCDSLESIDNKQRLTYAHFQSGNFDSTVFYALQGLQLAQEEEHFVTKHKLLNIIGQVYVQLGQPKKSLFYRHQMLALAEKMADEHRIILSLLNMASNYGELYGHTEQYSYLDSLAHVTHRALRLAQKNQEWYNVIRAQLLYAGKHFHDQNYQQTILYADSALTTAYQLPNTIQQINSAHIKKAYAYLELKAAEKARIAADSIVYYAEKRNNKAVLIIGKTQQYEAAKLAHDYPAALAYLEEAKLLSDSLTQTGLMERITTLEGKYTQEKNERAIEKLTQQQEIDTLQIRLLLAGIASCLLAIGFGIFYVKQRNLKHQTHLLRVEQRLNRSRLDPHFFFNMLASIHGDLLNGKDQRKAANQLAKSSHIMRQALESSYHDFITLEDEIEFLTNYLALQNARTEHKFDYHFDIDDSLAIDELLIPSMLTQPFIENAIIHGISGITEKGMIHISIQAKGEYLEITIDDNGKGINHQLAPHKQHPSRAYQITQDRLFLLEKTYKKKTNIEIRPKAAAAGVVATITIPIIYDELI
ncbi:MAG: histidine kinase [Flammeovirgaceae bacterium]